LIPAWFRRSSGVISRKNSVGVDQVADLIATVHRTLSDLGNSAPTLAPGPLRPAHIRRSAQHEQVIRLECGFHGQTPRRHLGTAHGLEAAEYGGRRRFSRNHALAAPAYSARHSTMAKELRLGRKPAQIEAPAPKRRGRKSRSAAAQSRGGWMSAGSPRHLSF
jgi:MucR family transcriptional regulator, transcriptional regulator of exopolysaccharide biosynthesis